MKGGLLYIVVEFIRENTALPMYLKFDNFEQHLELYPMNVILFESFFVQESKYTTYATIMPTFQSIFQKSL